MGKCSREAQVRAIRQRARERWQLCGWNAQTVHSRVNLEVKINEALARLARARGSFFQEAQLIGAHDRRREVRVENALLLARPEAGQDQDRFANAALAQLGAFRGAGHAEPIGANLRQGARDGNDSLAVGFAVEDGEDFPTRAAAAGGVDVGADRTEIVGKGSQTYFRPDG